MKHTKGCASAIFAPWAGLEAPDRADPEYPRFEALHRTVFDAFAVNGRLQIDYDTLVVFGQPCLVEQRPKAGRKS